MFSHPFKRTKNMPKPASIGTTFKLFAAICLLLATTITSVHSQTIHVSPAGDDSNDGSSGSPVLTFQRGADLAAQQGAATVQFADGEYVFDTTAVLNQSHNGISFVAEAGASPVFSSLVQVTDWAVEDENILVADLPEGISRVRFLLDRSENWMERSSTQFFSTTEAASFEGCVECNNYDAAAQATMSNIRYPASFSAPDWNSADQYDLRATTLPWHQEILPIASVDSGARRIFTAVPALYELRQDAEEVAPRAWVLNTLEGIDTPGEWACIDNEIYLWPISGTDDIFVPQLTELIRIDDGTVDGNAAVTNPVTGITFEGITFTGTDFRAMETTDVTAQHDWMVVDQPDGMLRIRNAENIIVRDCVFEKSGGTGLRIDRYAQNVLVDNNTFSYLGRGGVNVAGRGPGYGDVSRNNEISYNTLEYIGMEKWASVAILLDNSSNNNVHHNYISNTYFTGIAVVGPRQLMFAAWAEGADAFYVGREFHFRELEPSIVQFMADNGGVLEGSQEAMRFVYNFDNRIEENALIDVCTGQEMLINGQIYVSGAQRSLSTDDIKTNYVERNYMYDSFEHSINDYAMYSDSDQDDCNYIGNMINGVNNGDNQLDPTPIILAFNQWAESENEGLGQITLRANLTENSTFCSNAECMHTLGIDFVEEGQIINGVGGSVEFISIYEQMYAAICDENFPQVDVLPGAAAVRAQLVAKIAEFGGSTPGCKEPPVLLGDVNLDGTVNLLDVQPFVNLLSNSLFQSEADINQDGMLNLLDVQLFVDLLSG